MSGCQQAAADGPPCPLLNNQLGARKQRPNKAPMLQVEGLCALVSGCEELVVMAQQHGTVIQVGCLSLELAADEHTGMLCTVLSGCPSVPRPHA